MMMMMIETPGPFGPGMNLAIFWLAVGYRLIARLGKPGTKGSLCSFCYTLQKILL